MIRGLGQRAPGKSVRAATLSRLRPKLRVKRFILRHGEVVGTRPLPAYYITSPVVQVQDHGPPLGSTSCRLYDRPHLFYIVYPSIFYHLALVRPRTLHSTTQPPHPIQVRILLPKYPP